MNVSAQVDSRLLDCPEFCAHAAQGTRSNVSPTRNQNCYGRYVQFGAQVWHLALLGRKWCLKSLTRFLLLR
jgi:hypothetical protein